MKAEFLTGFGLNDLETKQILDKINEEIAEATNVLKNKISDYDKKLETSKIESEAKFKALVLDNAINSKLSEVPEKYRKLIASQIDKEKITVNDDNSILGLEEQYSKLKEDYTNLFTENSNGIRFGFSVGNSSDDNTPTANSNNTLADIFGVKLD